MIDLKFLGNGSAFNYKRGNTAAFFIVENNMFLIDCGSTVFSNLQSKYIEVLKTVENINIIITHVHDDHIGSLQGFLHFCFYVLKKKAKILIPSHIENDINNLFNVWVPIEEEQYRNFYYKEYFENNIEFNFNNKCLIIKSTVEKHVPYMNSCGYIIEYYENEIKSESFYYSGDCNRINERVLDFFEDGKIDKMYIDTCKLPSEVHLDLENLKDLVKPEERSRVYCMHLDGAITEEEIRMNGFRVAGE